MIGLIYDFFNIENGRKRQTHISAAADCWTSTY